MMNVACPNMSNSNRSSVCARHTKTQEQRDNLRLSVAAVISVGRFDLLYGLTEITENYACVPRERDLYFIEKRKNHLCNACRVYRTHKSISSQCVLQFSADSSLASTTLRPWITKAGDIDHRPTKSHNDDR